MFSSYLIRFFFLLFRSSKATLRSGRPNHGYVESPTPADAFDSRNRTPVATRRQIEQNRFYLGAIHRSLETQINWRTNYTQIKHNVLKNIKSRSTCFETVYFPGCSLYKSADKFIRVSSDLRAIHK